MDSFYNFRLFLKKNLETVIFLILLGCLIFASLWSSITPDKNARIMADIFVNIKMDSTGEEINSEPDNTFAQNPPTERANQQADDEKNIAAESSTTKAMTSKGFATNLNQSSIDQNEPAKSNFHETTTNSNSKHNRNFPAVDKFPLTEKMEFGYLVITLGNAHEYGFGYVYIDREIWQLGNFNTTPLKVKLPTGRHIIEVKRDNFLSSPTDTIITIEKDVEKRVFFVLIPRKNLLSQ